MIELPEVVTLARQLHDSLIGRKVKIISPPTKEHKFCWFLGDPAAYNGRVRGCEVVSAEGFGIFVEIGFNNGYKLCMNDGINMRLVSTEEIPQHYQLLIMFQDGMNLVFTVAMYGGIVLHDGSYDNEYYLKEQAGVVTVCDIVFSILLGGIRSQQAQVKRQSITCSRTEISWDWKRVTAGYTFCSRDSSKKKVGDIG